jgi:hypothetical protein
LLVLAAVALQTSVVVVAVGKLSMQAILQHRGLSQSQLVLVELLVTTALAMQPVADAWDSPVHLWLVELQRVPKAAVVQPAAMGATT